MNNRKKMKSGDLLLFRPRCTMKPSIFTYFTHISVCISSKHCLEIHQAGHGIPLQQKHDDRPRVYSIQERIDTARDLGWYVYWSPSKLKSTVELHPNIQQILKGFTYNYLYYITELYSRFKYMICPAYVLQQQPRRKQTCATFAALILGYYLNLIDLDICRNKKLIVAATPDEVVAVGPYDRIFFII
jgi:hypothetical protein